MVTYSFGLLLGFFNMHSWSVRNRHHLRAEAISVLQRAAAIIEDNGGKMNSTEFAWMWTETYPGDPLTKEQVCCL